MQFILALGPRGFLLTYDGTRFRLPCTEDGGGGDDPLSVVLALNGLEAIGEAKTLGDPGLQCLWVSVRETTSDHRDGNGWLITGGKPVAALRRFAARYPHGRQSTYLRLTELLEAQLAPTTQTA